MNEPTSQENPLKNNDNEDIINNYIESIAPKRELICPITQELFNDPVVAEDGHTYERIALQRWFDDSKNKPLRSPATNSYLTGQSMFPNIAIKGMILSHREFLGKELLDRCFEIYNNEDSATNNARIIKALLDAGADTTMRMNTPSKCAYDGNTCLLFLIQCQNLQLSKIVINHECQKQQLQYYDANCNHQEKLPVSNDNGDSINEESENSAHSDDNSAKVSNDEDNTNNHNHPTHSSNTTTNIGLVTISNANGISCIQALTSILNTQNQLKNETDRKDWEDLLHQMKQYEQKEKVIVSDKQIQNQKQNDNYRELQSMIQQEQEGRQRRVRETAISRRADNLTSSRGDWRYYPSNSLPMNGSTVINIGENDITGSSRYDTFCKLLKYLWRKLQCLFIICFSVVLFFAIIYLLTSFFFGRRFISF